MNILKRFHIFEIALVAVILTIHLYAALSDAYNMPNAWFTRDDAYYYFKVAQNITEGRGSTFDGVNPTNGYHPLWMVICIPVFVLARFDLILPLRVLIMVMAGLNSMTAILIYRLVKFNLSHAAAILAASFWAFNTHIHYTVYEFGLETPLATFAVALFIYKLAEFEKTWRTKQVTAGQLRTLAGIATMVLFSRLDLVFLVVISGIWIIFRGRAIRWLLPMDIAAISFSMVIAIALRVGIKPYNSLYAQSALEMTIIALIVKIVTLYFFGAYQHPKANSAGKMVRQTILALITSTMIIAGLHLILVQFGIGQSLPRSALIVDLAFSTTGIFLIRMAAYWFSNHRIEAGTQTNSPLKEIFTNWKIWLSEAVIYYGIAGGALVLYMFYNKFAFGTYSPVSGQIKRWWGTIGNTVYDYPAGTWTAFLGLSQQGVYAAWQPASKFMVWLAALIKPLYPGADTQDERYLLSWAATTLIAGFIFFLNRGRTKEKFEGMALIPLISGCAIHIFSYTTTAYGGAKEWYWASQMVLLVLIGSILLDSILSPFQKTGVARGLFQSLAIGTGVYLAMNLGGYVRSVMRYNYFPPERPYMEVLPYLEENTQPGSMIGMTGGGNVGYFLHNRTIVNMDGLINSYDYFRAVQNGGAPGYLRDHGMDLIFANDQLLKLPPYYGQFAPYLESFSTYGGKSLFYLLEEPQY